MVESCFGETPATQIRMARAFEDDLRRKFLAAHDRGRQTVREITDNFGVSYGWGRKVIDQRRRNGQAERVRHRPGPRSRLTAELHRALAMWLEEQPDRTLVELERLLASQYRVHVCPSLLCRLLKRLGLRLKKSRSTHSSGTQKRTASDAWRLSNGSARSRRSG